MTLGSSTYADEEGSGLAVGAVAGDGTPLLGGRACSSSSGGAPPRASYGGRDDDHDDPCDAAALLSSAEHFRDEPPPVPEALVVRAVHPPSPSKPKFLSLDFDRIVNSYSNAAVRARNASRKIEGTAAAASLTSSKSATKKSQVAAKMKKEKSQVISDSGFTVSRWVLTFTVGLCTGLTAVCIIWFVEALVDVRVSFLNRQMQWATGHADPNEMERWYGRHRVWSGVGGGGVNVAPAGSDPQPCLGEAGIFAVYASYNLMLVLISTALCVFLSPEAAGSGIPEVKAYLNGIRVGLFDDLNLFWTKLLGTIFSVSSGLVVGPEGPVVHLGAILGSLVTKTGDLECWTRNFRTRHPRAAGVLGCADRRHIDVLQVQEKEKEGRHGGGGGNPSSARRSAEEEEGETTETYNGGNGNGREKKKRSNDSECAAADNGLLSSLFFYLSHFRNDLERRHLISVGAAAGFASAFGAPVGGLLYSMEEASSFFAHDMLWRTLFGTAVATCCIAVYHGDFTRYCMLSLEIGVQEESLLARFGEVPLYVVMGALGGVLGTGFNNVYHFVNHRRKHFYDGVALNRRMYIVCKMMESAVISVLTSVVMLAIPFRAKWACRPIEALEEEEEFDPGFLHRFNCPPGEMNEIGSILFGSREESIKDILTNPSEFEPETLLAVGLTFYLLMMVTFGMAIPQGMFMPTVLTGASLGGYAGLVFKANVIESVHPSDFAIIGAAAFLAGMQRNTVSLCVILMEGTGQTKAIIPVIITVVSARCVGDLLSEGIYEIGMELKGYPYLLHKDRERYDVYTASTVMNADVETVAMVETAGAIESLLLKSSHHAFPVVDGETGEYKGMVRRDQLIAALQCKIYAETIGGTGIDESERSSFHRPKKHVGFQVPAEEDSEHEEDEDEEDRRASLRNMKRRYSSARALPRLDDDVYSSQRSLREPRRVWNPNKPELVSPWLRDNILTSSDDNEVLFGMDETLPNGRIHTDTKAVVKILYDKAVVFVSPEDKDMHVDVGCIMNKAALSVLAEFPLSKTYDLFVSMGLRHLPVLGEGKRVVGVITRYHLLEEYVREKTGYHLY